MHIACHTARAVFLAARAALRRAISAARAIAHKHARAANNAPRHLLLYALPHALRLARCALAPAWHGTFAAPRAALSTLALARACR